MTKNLGYYGADYDNQLIRDIAETWGDDCSGATTSDSAWLIYQLAWKYCMELGIAGINIPSSGEASEVKERINELNQNELISLVRAIANRDMTKPLGYWGLSYSNELIKDISETWNELQDISEIDQYWLISELAEIYFKLYCECPSEEAVEILYRIDEFDTCQTYALIRCLAN